MEDIYWFIKKPFLVPVGAVLTYKVQILNKEHEYVYTTLDEFTSDSTKDVRVKGKGGVIYPACSSPAFYVNFDPTSIISFDIPNAEFKPGDIVYNRNNKKFIVADEESCSRNLTEVYCRIEGEKGVYLIPREDLSFEPSTAIPGDNTGNPQLRTKTILFKDQETLDVIEFFPSTPTPGQFKAMLELSNLSQELYKGHSFDRIGIDESESIPNAQGDEEFKPNSAGGIKFDSKKARPTLLLKSMPDAVQEVIDVLELGARKYAPDNWKKVENARYHDAMLRHILAYLGGETLDQETIKHHLAHAVCNMLFLIQKEGTTVPDAKEKESDE
jgi:hypothetical protein